MPLSSNDDFFDEYERPNTGLTGVELTAAGASGATLGGVLGHKGGRALRNRLASWAWDKQGDLWKKYDDKFQEHATEPINGDPKRRRMKSYVDPVATEYSRKARRVMRIGDKIRAGIDHIPGVAKWVGGVGGGLGAIYGAAKLLGRDTMQKSAAFEGVKDKIDALDKKLDLSDDTKNIAKGVAKGIGAASAWKMVGNKVGYKLTRKIVESSEKDMRANLKKLEGMRGKPNAPADLSKRLKQGYEAIGKLNDIKSKLHEQPLTKGLVQAGAVGGAFGGFNAWRKNRKEKKKEEQ